MKRFFAFINNIITSGIEGGYESEPVRKAVTINLFAFIGLSFMILYSIESIFKNNISHAIILIAFGLVTIGLFLFLRFTKNYLISSHAIVLLMIGLNLYLFISGGDNTTGILWLYVFPILCLFTVGIRTGVLYITFLLFIVAISFYFKPSYITDYPPEMKSRFVSTFLAVTFMSLTFEFVRQKTYSELIESNNKKSFYLNKVLDQQKEIIEQSEVLKTTNKELEQHQNHLELLVKERTEELEIAKEKAEESDRLKSAFLANMSHEIRTPMNAIMGFSNLLIDPEVEDSLKKEMVQHITQNTNSLLKLIEDIIGISKIEAGQLEARISKVDIHSIFAEVYSEFENMNELLQKEQLNLILDNDIYQNSLEINTDSSHIKRILSNLLDNAFKFTDKGEIHFGYKLFENIKDPHIQIYVKDTGIGLSEVQQTRIFNRFTKAEISKKKLYRGAGLGLSICKSLVEILGGRIWVDSEEDKGAIFSFNIPFDNSEITESQITNKKEKAKNYHWEKKSILIADDEPGNYRQLDILLSKTGAKLYHAKNGLEAVEIATNHSIDLILMDIKMPVMNGLEAARKIKSLGKKIPIIAQTAFTLEYNEKESIDSGCDAFLSKPIKKPQLLSILNAYLA